MFQFSQRGSLGTSGDICATSFDAATENFAAVSNAGEVCFGSMTASKGARFKVGGPLLGIPSAVAMTNAHHNHCILVGTTEGTLGLWERAEHVMGSNPPAQTAKVPTKSLTQLSHHFRPGNPHPSLSVRSVGICPTDALAVAACGNEVAVYDIRTLTKTASIHTNDVYGDVMMAVSPIAGTSGGNPHHLAHGSIRGTFGISDIRTSSPMLLRSNSRDGAITNIFSSERTRTISCGRIGGKLDVFDERMVDEPLHTIDTIDHILSLTLYPNHSEILVAGCFGGNVKAWSLLDPSEPIFRTTVPNNAALASFAKWAHPSCAPLQILSSDGSFWNADVRRDEGPLAVAATMYPVSGLVLASAPPQRRNVLMRDLDFYAARCEIASAAFHRSGERVGQMAIEAVHQQLKVDQRDNVLDAIDSARLEPEASLKAPSSIADAREELFLRLATEAIRIPERAVAEAESVAEGVELARHLQLPLSAKQELNDVDFQLRVVQAIERGAVSEVRSQLSTVESVLLAMRLPVQSEIHILNQLKTLLPVETVDLTERILLSGTEKLLGETLTTAKILAREDVVRLWKMMEVLGGPFFVDMSHVGAGDEEEDEDVQREDELLRARFFHDMKRTQQTIEFVAKVRRAQAEEQAQRKHTFQHHHRTSSNAAKLPTPDAIVQAGSEFESLTHGFGLFSTPNKDVVLAFLLAMRQTGQLAPMFFIGHSLAEGFRDDTPSATAAISAFLEREVSRLSTACDTLLDGAENTLDNASGSKVKVDLTEKFSKSIDEINTFVLLLLRCLYESRHMAKRAGVRGDEDSTMPWLSTTTTLLQDMLDIWDEVLQTAGRDHQRGKLLADSVESIVTELEDFADTIDGDLLGEDFDDALAICDDFLDLLK